MANASNISNSLKRKVSADEDRLDKLAKLAKMNQTNAVTVKLGDNPKGFRIVHRDIICSQSAYLKRVLIGQSEDRAKIDLRVEEIPLAHFDLYLEWLYTRRSTSLDKAVTSIAKVNADKPDKGCTSSEHLDHRTFHVLVDIWLVGDLLQDTKFQDQIIRAIFRIPHELRTLATKCAALRSVMLNTPDQGSKLRRACLDLMECRVVIGDVDDLEMEDWTKDIVVLLMKRLGTLVAQGDVPRDETYVEEDSAAVEDLS
ncbi:hypothetical protein DOTSEDRAFT_29138 [Dothistroma septosporum NZE10]|uniref:BTB domain-containing protein n=1 Tax=Dothistroma septosporum (strain NZE10 / CBS 128990) TaxID=675120 RepID=M2Y0W6_DOTSN|nr:hypothetical protein DOTSEDRAFT_29138 [Dothistroma septosporum NZE10]